MTYKIQDHNFEFMVDEMIPKENISKHPRFERFMEIARSVSELSTYDKYRLGAVITIKGAVVAKGYNQAKTHPTQKRYNAQRFDVTDKSNHFLHAEMAALNKVKHLDLSQAEIHIYHIGNNGEQKMARPCAACMKAIKDRGIKRIHYSTPEGLASEYIDKKNVIVKRGRKPI